MNVRIGVALPSLDQPDPRAVVAGARHVERLGLESAWASDVIIGDGTPSLESVVVLAAAAGATSRVRLGFGVLVLPLRPVPLLAAQLATLQHVSADRVVLGVGVGGFPESPFWRASGVPPGERGRRTDAALALLPGLVSGARTDVGGVGVELAPGATRPPILVGGGGSEAVLRRVVRFGDGWLPSLTTPAAVARGARRLRELADGRAAPTITVGVHTTFGPPSTQDDVLRDLVGHHGMTPDEAASVVVSGDPPAVAERFAAYVEAGAERILVALDGPDWMRQCELLAEVDTLLR
ncbi:Flavin-dependent oxidoreductase, luciferase family (includes alkanesulfonate monooxygenase SsuD and methylene tetrahydromethanopterin reductase) [Amycolatopsis arida]|uniref:Flavin-dependent oxidoreductase, luciferase family (Includes alkanesulfonate monooxygenase SsuD and methylene tetrahydromethanopterin reductase) n=1 Tax=Amycolatopsis arida TaxID=587909 RepID=A0A1I5TWX4_9PSEU|nr:LLM class flavin-dependent oxidoreductase [Amycolatopsis arida]TDX95932.1 alkanesulfonate monooxygenase SsuD/methylene tetrahydromethanopterin reductase-like flavin-dependent oxidoreductase (luciferase family) [Amycolatopsis arida]SFP87509.1 Flavin-dependent oxidoreductase, luciferase family (includes alkanesulfonate monooxygenase SsuD and methylene tetrahydromethanopterin reductase) [Amycolatopsis arida]